MPLKTDYKDYIATQGRKYRIMTNADGISTIEDVTQYDMTGDLFGARDINVTNSTVNTHTANKSNPHAVTKVQLGLGNVSNTADKDKSVNNSANLGGVPAAAFGRTDAANTWKDTNYFENTCSFSSQVYLTNGFLYFGHVGTYGNIKVGPNDIGCTFQLGNGWYNFTDSSGVLGNINGKLVGSSSRTIKDDIAPISEDHIAKLMELRPVSFKYKADGSEGLGLIAQEVQEVYPNLVYQQDPENEDTMAISYIELVAPLLATVQHQAKEINSLKADIEAIANRLAELENAK